MRALRDALRLALVALCALVWGAVPAFGASTTATFSAAGTAIDTVFGSGSCAVSLAGEASGSGISGSGTFAALEGPHGGVCSPGEGAFRYQITGGTVSADHAHFSVK